MNTEAEDALVRISKEFTAIRKLLAKKFEKDERLEKENISLIAENKKLKDENNKLFT